MVVQVDGIKMFVFYKNQYGGIRLDDRTVHGYMEKFPPTQISWNTYKQNHNILIQASYNQDRLTMLFPHATFPKITFLYSDLRYLTWEQMCDLCQAFGLKTGRSNHERRRSLRKFMQEHC